MRHIAFISERLEMPKVKCDILKWARKTAGLSLEQAAKKLSIRDGKKSTAAEKLSSYEDGSKEPSRSLLRRMASQYNRPLLTFYLEHPPVSGDRGEDFRHHPSRYEAFENVRVDVLIRDIKARQSVIRESLLDTDEDGPLDFVGKHRMSDGMAALVKTIVSATEFDLGDYAKRSSYREAFNYLRKKVEDAGVFVILKGNLGSHHSSISSTVFRGFALSDPIAPFIVINDQDSEKAWSFTLLHEFAHLLLGRTGVSGSDCEMKIEKFCNSVASELLLPEVIFDSFKPDTSSREELCAAVDDFAYSAKLSSSHVLYRLFLRGDISKRLWLELSEEYRQSYLKSREFKREKSRLKDGGPDYYVVRNNKLGALVGVVRHLTYSGALSTTKAGLLLGVKPLKVHKLFEAGQ